MVATTLNNDVFISYSRRDKEFVTSLHDRLIGAKYDVWLDVEDIPPAVNFLDEIFPAIEASNKFVFIISPDSVASQYCAEELTHAIQLNKPLIPVVCRAVPVSDLNEYLRPINWINFELDGFETGFGKLLDAVRTDQEIAVDHRRFLVRALQWDKKGRNPGFLLVGDDLKEAEAWQLRSVGKQPEPLQIHLEYIAASRKAADVRQRNLLLGVSVALIVALVLAAFAFYQSQIANRRADEAQSIAWAIAARDLNVSGDPYTALALALEANRISNPPSLARLTLANSAYQPGMRHRYEANLRDKPINFTIISPGRQTALSVSMGELILWDIVSGTPILSFSGTSNNISEAVFSPDGNWIASGSCTTFDKDNQCTQGEITIWDTKTGHVLEHVTGIEGEVIRLAISPDRQTLSAVTKISAELGSTIFVLTVWDLGSGHVLYVLDRVQFSALSFSDQERSLLAYSPDSHSLFSKLDRHLNLWSIPSGGNLRNYTDLPTTLNSVTFSSDGQLILAGICSADFFISTSVPSPCVQGDILLLDAASGNILFNSADQAIQHHQGNVIAVAFSPDGKIALSAGGHSMFLWNLTNYSIVHNLIGEGRHFTFDPDGKTGLSVEGSKSVATWELKPGNEVFNIQSGEPSLKLALSPDGNHALSAGASFQPIILWDLRTNPPQDKIIKPADQDIVDSYLGSLFRLAYRPDGDTVLLAYEGGLVLWDIQTASTIRIFMNDDDTKTLNDFDFSPDEKWIAAGSCASRKNGNCERGEIVIWEVATGNILNRFLGHEGFVSSVEFSPNGNTLLSASEDKTLILWETKSGSKLKHFQGHQQLVYDAIFSPDEQTILSISSDYRLILWNVNSGSIIRSFEVQQDRNDAFPIHFGYVSQSLLAFSADSRTALSAVGKEVVWWDTTSGLPIGAFSGHLQPIHDLSFNGQRALSVSCVDSFMGCSGTQVILWRIDTIDALKHWTFDNRYVPELTCNQRLIYLVQPYCDADEDASE